MITRDPLGQLRASFAVWVLPISFHFAQGGIAVRAVGHNVNENRMWKGGTDNEKTRFTDQRNDLIMVQAY